MVVYTVTGNVFIPDIEFSAYVEITHGGARPITFVSQHPPSSFA